jgi:broad specificity phosphatase PhoE
MNDTRVSEKPIRILLVRHGESGGNVDPAQYVTKGDSKVSLTEKGWRQVERTGKFLSGYYAERETSGWPLIHVSTHQRTLESLSGILYGMGDVFVGKPKIYPQAFLTEKFFGAASALSFLDDAIVPREFRDNLAALSKAVFRNDPFQAGNLFGESTKDTMIAAKLLMETLRRDIDEGKRDHLVVCHGAVIQVMLMNWMHAMPQDKNKIGNPGNGDVIEILGAPKNWSFTRIYDGEHSVPMHENLREKVPRFTVADLPPVPDFLKRYM